MANRRKLLRAEQRRHAKTAARLAACACNPDLGRLAAGHLLMRHDDWCPAATAPSQILVYVPQRCER